MGLWDGPEGNLSCSPCPIRPQDKKDSYKPVCNIPVITSPKEEERLIESSMKVGAWGRGEGASLSSCFGLLHQRLGIHILEEVADEKGKKRCLCPGLLLRNAAKRSNISWRLASI